MFAALEQQGEYVADLREAFGLPQNQMGRDDFKAILLTDEFNKKPTKLSTQYGPQWVYGPEAGVWASQSENPDAPQPVANKWGVTDGESETIYYSNLEALLDAVLDWRPAVIF